jgi:hypothetical protein
MKLALKAVESVGTSNWSEDAVKGTLSENLDKGDKLSFSDKNLRDDSKRIVVFVHEKGEDVPKLLVCSQQLSNIARKAFTKGKSKKEMLRVFLGLRIIESDNGFFLVMNGGVGELFSLEEITKAEKVDYEELVAF